MKFAIVGAGMAGLACADVLACAGHAVTLFDKGRCPGGRMSTRRLATPLGEVAFDHGAQYFTARDPGFRSQVAAWADRQVVAPWPVVADDAWVGRPGMNAVVKHMAAAHAVLWGQRIAGLVRHGQQWRLVGETGNFGPFDAVLLAIPAEQAAPILSLHNFPMACIAIIARSHPCWSSLLVFDRVLPLPPIIRTGGDIAWATCNSTKPHRGGPEAWVVQATASWSTNHIDGAPDKIATLLHSALATATGVALPDPIAAASHRWRYALSPGTGDGALWNPDIGLGACGDWLLGPRVECAWLSGRMLAERVGQSPTPSAAAEGVGGGV
jgi:predicted NAD/FAD-dependent oxidoreductase